GDVAALSARREEAAVRAPSRPGKSGDVVRPEPPAGSVVGRNLTVVAPYEQQASPRLERGHDDVPAETQHPCLAHRGEARAEHACGLTSRGEIRGLQCQLNTELRIGRNVRERAAGELAAVRAPRLRPRVAALDEGEDGDAGDDRQRKEARGDDREQAATLAVGADPLALEPVLGLPRQ